MKTAPDRPNMCVLTALLVFKRFRFIEECEKYREALNNSERLKILDNDPDRASWSEDQTSIIRRSLGYSALLVLGVVAVSVFVGIGFNRFFGPAQGWPPRIILYTGIGILLWATLGKGGWDIESIDGTTLPEEVDRFVFRVLHLTGSAFLILSATWQVAGIWA